MITLGLLAAAVAVAVWPARAGGLSLESLRPMPAAKPHATYAEAIHALSVVRGRLLATESLTDKERAAVDALTLALVNGSDKE
jgi:hypothetical protein